MKSLQIQFPCMFGEEKISSSYIRILDPVIPQTGLPQWLRGKESAWNAGYSGGSGLIPRLDDPLEEGMATCSSVLAWRIPRTEEPGWPQSQTWLKRLITQHTFHIEEDLNFPSQVDIKTNKFRLEITNIPQILYNTLLYPVMSQWLPKLANF